LLLLAHRWSISVHRLWNGKIMLAKLNLRIRQLHRALEQVRTEDLASVRPRTGLVSNTYVVRVDFSGGTSDADLANIVSLVVANIARLKDHLKAWCKTHSKPFRGDILIDSSRDVGIIHDLWNRDKHFDLTNSRSGLNPEIRNISRVARLSTQARVGSFVAMTLDSRGKLQTRGDGKVELVIDADIVDSTGARLGGLIEIAERATTEWEAALVTAGVAVPPRSRRQ
jgi:hypothetical protein